MDKLAEILTWINANWALVAPILFFCLDLLGRWIPTVKRGSLWSSLGKLFHALGSLWFLGPVGKLLQGIGDLLYKIADQMSKVVPDKRK